MRGQATPTTPAKSVGLNVFHGVRAPVWTSRRETGHEVSPRRPISNVFPSLVQRKGVSPDCEPCIGCGSPPSIGTKAIPSLVTAATRLPSGENAFAEPCPKRTADAPFVSRLKTAYSPPPASPASMNSTSFASSEMSTGTVQSCQLRSRSLFSPGARPIAPERIASREIRARPLVLASCSVSIPGALSNSRSLPDKLTPRIERLNHVAVAVNQTSSPEGDQAKPKALAQRSVKSDFLPLR